MKIDKIPLVISFFVSPDGIVELNVSDDLCNYDLPTKDLLRMRDLAEIFFNKIDRQKRPTP